MIIGIDGNEANVGKRVGVGKYAHELLWQFYQIRNPKSEILNKLQIQNYKFQIFLKNEPLPDLPKETDWWQYKVVGPKRFWTQIGLPIALYKDCRYRGRQINVFFTPSHYAPRFSPVPTVISIMDLSYLHFPRMFKRSDLYQLKNWTAYSIRKAKKILTISEFSKNDIIRYYRVPEEQVVVTYPGFEMKTENRKQKTENIREKYGIEGDYILSVGTLQPRKNYGRLIEALNILVSQYPSISLVIVGKKGWLYEEILAAPEKYGVEDKVKFLDFVPDEDLPLLYREALCFVLPSLYEGFGLPVLEAMSCSCPVVVSNVSSLPEIVGEAGILVDPYSVQSIAAGLKTVINYHTTEYGKYEDLIKKGLEQVKKFSWEKCAKETLKVLEETGKRV